MRRPLSVVVGLMILLGTGVPGVSARGAKPPAPTGVSMSYTSTFELRTTFKREERYQYVEQLWDGGWVQKETVTKTSLFRFTAYRVAAVDDGVRGPWKEVNITTSAPPVRNLQIARSGPRTFLASWKAPADSRPSGYAVAALKDGRWDYSPNATTRFGISDSYEQLRVAAVVGDVLGEFAEIDVPTVGPVRDLAYKVVGKTVPVTWQKPLVQNPNRRFSYEIEGAERDGDWRRLGNRESGKYTLPSDESDIVRIRVRAIGGGDTGEWSEIVIDRDAVVDISIGQGHACALVVTGIVKCWGYNKYGQTGSDPGTPTPTAEKVPGLSRVVDIDVGFFHSCALDDRGKVWCWGFNEHGQLGDGTTRLRSTPKIVPDLPKAVSLAVGYGHTCVALADGTVRCWGDNANLQSGPRAAAAQTTPVVVPGIDGIEQVSAGRGSTCALTAGPQPPAPKSVTGRLDDEDAGVVYCWGDNFQGSLGDGTARPSAKPRRVENFQNFSSIAVGADFGCALFDQDGVGLTACWGAASDGQLGISTIASVQYESPTISDTFGATVRSVSAGAFHTCTVRQDASVWCSGMDAMGQLGDGPEPNYTRVATQVPDFSATAVEAGFMSTCAVDQKGRAWCWGENTMGQLGDGTTVNRPSPVRVKGF